MKKVLFAATSLLAYATVAADAATFINRTGETAYVRVEYPTGGGTNFRLRTGVTDSVNIGPGVSYYCYSTRGRMNSCGRDPNYRITNNSRIVLD